MIEPDVVGHDVLDELEHATFVEGENEIAVIVEMDDARLFWVDRLATAKALRRPAVA